MQIARLKDFVGEPSSFYLSIPDKVFHLDKFTLGHRVWATNTFGDDFNIASLKQDQICRLAFQLMTLESKRVFLSKEVSFVNEMGEEFTKRLGGPELMFWQVSGLNEIHEINKAISITLMGSKLVNEAMSEDEKKNEVQESQTPGQASLPTGEKFLTSSQASTDGPQSKSSHAPKKKLGFESRRLGSARTTV